MKLQKNRHGESPCEVKLLENQILRCDWSIIPQVWRSFIATLEPIRRCRTAFQRNAVLVQPATIPATPAGF